jgi:FkbM family methyltransferase
MLNAPRWFRGLNPVRIAEIVRAFRRVNQPVAFARAYLRLSHHQYPFRLTLRGGQTLELSSWHDIATAWVVVCRNEYPVAPDARCILDCGANFGAFTVFAASRAPRARIVSVEPHPDELPRLHAHIRANQLMDRVDVVPQAVASRAGQRWMDTDPAQPSPSRGLFAESDVAPEASTGVEAATLGSLLERATRWSGTDRIDLVKMDVEGAEHEFLQAITPEVLAPVDAWVMEYHPDGPKSELFAALERSGLALVRDLPAGRDSGVAYFRRGGGLTR